MNHRKKSSSGLSGLAKRKRHAEEYGARPQTPKLFHYRANNGTRHPPSPSPSPSPSLPSSPAPSTPIKHHQTPSYTMPPSPFSTPLKNGLGGGMGGGGGGGVRENERPFTGEGITNLTIPAQNTWEKRGVMKYFTHASIAFWGILQFLSGGKFRASEEQVRFMTRFFLLIFMIAFVGCLFYRAGTQEPLVIVQGPSNEELERNMKEAFDKLSDDYHGLAEWVVTLTKGWAKTSWKTDALLKRVEIIEQIIDNGLPEPLPTPSPPTPPTPPPVSPPPPTPNPDWATSEEVKEMIGEKMKEEIDSLNLESTIKGLVNDMLNARTPPPPPPSPPVDSNTPPPPSPPIDTSSFVKKEAFFAELRELQGQVTAFSRSWEELEAVKQSIKLLKGEVGERMEEMEEVRRKEEKERERKRELEKARETEERGKENAERAKEREQEKAREREEKARWEEEKRKGEEKLRGLVRGIEVLQNSLDVLETNIKTDLEKLKQANKEHQQRPPVDDLSVPVASLTSKIERLEEKITAVEETQENVKENFETVTSALQGVDLKEVKSLHEVHENIEKLQDEIIRSSYLDGTGMIDWAAESLGAVVKYPEITLFDDSPKRIIQANTALGECWNMAGSEGGFLIQLSNPIVPSHVSMEHNRIVPAGELRQAPKQFTVWGANQAMAEEIPPRFDFLGEFTYDTNNPHPIQTFPVVKEGETIHTIIKVKISSNYGGDSTCIYRFRVHGEQREFD